MQHFFFPRSRQAALLAALGFAATFHAHAQDTLSAWTPLFQGIDFATGSATVPQQEAVYALRIDLDAPGISFTTTPADSTTPGFETESQTTSSFLTSVGAAVAINGNFFSDVETTQVPENLSGLAVSNGNVVSPADTSFPSLLLSALNSATITTTSSSTNLSNVFNAVSGSSIILQNGIAVDPGSSVSGDPEGLDPRTGVGLSQNGEFLYMVVVDGRQTGYSLGSTQEEEGQWLADMGAYTGLNLDGGGSSAMVASDGSGGATVINRPSGGTERLDGNNLAVFANALPTPVPTPTPNPTPTPPSSTPYSDTIKSTGPVMYLPLTETSGSTATDASGNGHNGTYAKSGVTLGQTSTPILSQAGTTIKTAGSPGDRVTVPFSTAFEAGSFTIEAWADPTAISSAFEAVVSDRHDHGSGAAGNAGFILYDGPADGVTGDTWQFWTGGSTAQTYNFEGRNRAGYGAGPAVTANQWAFVVGTFQATSGPDANGRYTGTQDLYVNGVLALTLSGIQYLPDPDEPLYIGAGENELNPNDGLDFSGGLAQVAYYNTALTGTQIEQQYQAAAVPEASCVWLVALGCPVLAMYLRKKSSVASLK